MDRISGQTRARRRAVVFGVAFFAVYFGLPSPSHSATRLLLVDRADQRLGDDNYPESRFGAEPARVDFGVTRIARSSDDASFGAASGSSIELDRMPASAPESSSGTEAARPSADDARSAVPTVSVPPPGPSAFEKAQSLDTQEREVKRGRRTVTVRTAGGSGEPLITTPEMQSAAIRRKGVQEVSLIAGDLGFFPKTFFVTRDVPVRLFVTGASKRSLCIMMESFQVRRQIKVLRVEEITFTPQLPGEYRYFCPINGIEGTMVVRELAQTVYGKDGAE